MQYQPYEYQKYAIDFIIEHPAAALFLDCGLGKTSITLSAIRQLKYEKHEIDRVLVVAPIRVAAVSWPDELRRWDHLQDLTCSVAVGPEQKRRAAMNQDADIYIINRENVAWLVEDCWKHPRFDMLVIDELSSFKNHESKRFRELMKLRPEAKRVVGLSGTPTGNGLKDLYAEFRLLDMGERLGRSYRAFCARYCREEDDCRLLPDAEAEIYERIGDITISMDAAEYLNMPKLISTEYRVEMSIMEAEQYNDLKHEMIENMLWNLADGMPHRRGSKDHESRRRSGQLKPEGMEQHRRYKEPEEAEITVANAGVLTGKLLQLASGAVYDEHNEVVRLHDRKLKALEDIIESSNGKPVLVAYWFRHDLERICAHLKRRKIDFLCIRGEKSIRAWNTGSVPVGLIHPASAGHGLNLQAGGSHLVWFGLTWSLELYQQTNARLYRQGQTAATVVIQHIITSGTMDERVLDALKQKNCTQAALLEAVRAELGTRTTCSAA